MGSDEALYRYPGRFMAHGRMVVTEWPKDELRKIVEADDLHIAPFREDGATFGTPTWMWSVAVDDCLYVRGYNGRKSSWYQAAIAQKAGRVIAAGITKEVVFEPVEGQINNRIDEAYRAKYHGSPYLEPMVGARARSATIRIIPRETASEISNSGNKTVRKEYGDQHIIQGH